MPKTQYMYLRMSEFEMVPGKYTQGGNFPDYHTRTLHVARPSNQVYSGTYRGKETGVPKKKINLESCASGNFDFLPPARRVTSHVKKNKIVCLPPPGDSFSRAFACSAPGFLDG